ncbi:MAG: N-acetyl-gamma-glutamyl-phosphate reductase [Pseudomonadales bacterium]|nr:N-acetyl-gamma-glutamyl-phosphate reductase [Pseudomonadales bacterium]
MIKVGIIGATGYTGIELLRLLAPRKDIEIVVVTSREKEGLSVQEHFPNLRGHLDLKFAAPESEALNACDVVFYATPHGVAMHSVPTLLDKGVRIIDLSADFRIKDIALWEDWYKTAHNCPELVENAVYGLPEVNRSQIASADLVAVPGCYPTAIQLGFLPLLEQGIVVADRLIADAKSGVSGAGRKAVEDYLFCEANESIKAYGVSGHRHHPEICQELNLVCDQEVKLTFIPHLAPMIRGILATLYAPVDTGQNITIDRLQSIFEHRYADEPFVEVLPMGLLPATRDVKGSNKCEISVNYSSNTDTVVVFSSEDNLVKGASGQAIQNMNLMFELGETTGLESIALLP